MTNSSRARPRGLGRAAVAALTTAGLAATALVLSAGTAVAADTLGAAAAQTGRYFGAAVVPNLLNDSSYSGTLSREFNSVVAENAMKWDATEPNRNQFSFGGGDQIVNYARSRGMSVRGHTLVWHAQYPGWVGNLNGNDLRQAMVNHINGVAGHWRGQIHSWDVVNEAFEENGSRRQSIFQQRLGNGYIEEAFRAARTADPNAKLCYNDYNTDGINAKSTAIYNMVVDFRNRGVPIDCVGIQSHLSANSNLSSYQANLKRFSDLGVDVQITELDVGGSGTGQANVYRQVTQACMAVARCTGITTWGITDRHTWRPNDTPLLFDSNYQKKPAYQAVLDALNAGGGNGGETTGAVRAVAANRCVDVPNQSTATGTRVQIWDCGNGANQQWTRTSANELTVYSGDSRRCLDASGNGTTNGTAVIIWTCHGGNNQKWNVNANGTITSAQSGLCLEVSGSSTANGALLQLWSCTGGANQRFQHGTTQAANVTPAAATPSDVGTAAASAGCGKAPTLASGNHTIQSSGKNRTFILRLPDGYDRNRPYRLIFGYHWLGGTANDVNSGGSDGANWSYYGQQRLANNSAIFVAPQGISNGWANSGGEDVTFTDDMIRRIEADLCVDTSLRFALGFSYGGGMSYSLACSRANVFRAVAVYSGAQLSGCSGGTQPIAYMGIHGLGDTVLNISQGRSLRDRFVRNNGCTAQNPPEPAQGSRSHTLTTYSGCRAGYPVVWAAFDGGHTPAPIDGGGEGWRTWTAGAVWTFFSQFGGGDPDPDPDPDPEPGACRVTDTVNAWNTGLTSEITVTNTGTAAIDGWSLVFTLPGGQTITSGWNASYSPTSGQVTARNVDYNADIAPGGSVSIGFQASHTGNTGEPTAFTLNGAACTVT